jgi:hypothetical protein
MTPQNKQVRATYVTPAFRVSYPALFEPVAVLGNEAKKIYSLTMLFPKKSKVEQLKAAKHPVATWMSTDNCAAFWQEIVKIARANFGPEVDLKGLKLTKFRDGDKPKDSGKTEENEKGYIIVRTSSKDRPDCMRADKTRISDPSELYPGCWARAVLTVATFLVPQHGVTIYLAGVQKFADDSSFSSRPRAEDAFDTVAVEGLETTGAGEVPSGDALPFDV